MTEVIAALAGVVVGALIEWWREERNRRRVAVSIAELLLIEIRDVRKHLEQGPPLSMPVHVYSRNSEKLFDFFPEECGVAVVRFYRAAMALEEARKQQERLAAEGLGSSSAIRKISEKLTELGQEINRAANVALTELEKVTGRKAEE